MQSVLTLEGQIERKKGLRLREKIIQTYFRSMINLFSEIRVGVLWDRRNLIICLVPDGVDACTSLLIERRIEKS